MKDAKKITEIMKFQDGIFNTSQLKDFQLNSLSKKFSAKYGVNLLDIYKEPSMKNIDEHYREILDMIGEDFNNSMKDYRLFAVLINFNYKAKFLGRAKDTLIIEKYSGYDTLSSWYYPFFSFCWCVLKDEFIMDKKQIKEKDTYTNVGDFLIIENEMFKEKYKKQSNDKGLAVKFKSLKEAKVIEKEFKRFNEISEILKDKRQLTSHRYWNI